MTRRSVSTVGPTLLILLGLIACEGGSPDENAEPAAAAPSEAGFASDIPAPSPDVPAGAYVVEVVAEDYGLEAPDEILSGWTTFRLKNEGEETHFLLLTRMPDGLVYDDYVEGLSQPINDVWYRMRDQGLGKEEAFGELGAAIPAWYWTDAETFGGPGMVMPGGISQATIELQPGLYVLECFMKTADGEFHWSEGMIRPMVVLDERSEAGPPEAGLHLTLTTAGITSEGEARPGTNTVALTFAEQPEVGFGNDVHVVRLEDGVAPESLVAWMDAFNLEGLQDPPPAAFVGGSHERKTGNTVYFDVDLVPGRYAWFSEGTDANGGMFLEFEVR
jgi:hypothetical protein